MAKILNIETSSYVCSVAYSVNGIVEAIKESSIDKSHASLLTVYIEQILSEQKISASNLDAVAVSKGPGSYTGLRIGVSTAKGICYGSSIPLIFVCSLQSMAIGIINHPEANAVISKHEANTLLCPMIDARRMEVYTALYTTNNKQLGEITASIINEASFQDELKKHKIIFFGNGAPKCKQFINHENAIYIDDFEPSAQFMTSVSENAFNMKLFENTAYFEPFYLKDFIPTIPKKNIF